MTIFLLVNILKNSVSGDAFLQAFCADANEDLQRKTTYIIDLYSVNSWVFIKYEPYVIYLFLGNEKFKLTLFI